MIKVKERITEIFTVNKNNRCVLEELGNILVGGAYVPVGLGC